MHGGQDEPVCEEPAALHATLPKHVRDYINTAATEEYLRSLA